MMCGRRATHAAACICIVQYTQTYFLLPRQMRSASSVSQQTTTMRSSCFRRLNELRWECSLRQIKKNVRVYFQQLFKYLRVCVTCRTLFYPQISFVYFPFTAEAPTSEISYVADTAFVIIIYSLANRALSHPLNFCMHNVNMNISYNPFLRVIYHSITPQTSHVLILSVFEQVMYNVIKGTTNI